MTTLLTVLISTAAAAALSAQTTEPSQKQWVQYRTYSPAEDERVLKMYDGLRVADVSDGLDMAGLQDIGLMSPDIRPLWRDTDNFDHRVIGIAVTARYVPTNRRADRMTPEDFRKWEGNWYGQLSPEPFVSLLRSGSVLVIDGRDHQGEGAGVLSPAWPRHPARPQ
jgi:hypothetical protein